MSRFGILTNTTKSLYFAAEPRSLVEFCRNYRKSSQQSSGNVKLATHEMICDENFANGIKNTVRSLPDDPESISLCASVPIFQPPKFIGDLAKQSIINPESKVCFYSSRSCKGTPELQQATIEYYQKHGVNINNQVPIFTNSEHAIITMLADLLKRENSSAIMTIPTFGLFFNPIYNHGLKTHLISLTPKTNWKLTPEILRNSLDYAKDARLFFLINPDNPTGKIYSKQELEDLSHEFISHNQQRKEIGQPPLILISDEASRRILLNKNKEKFFNIASIPKMEEFTVTISTSSKDLAPGLAICHGLAPKWIMDLMLIDESKALPDALATDRYGPSYISQYILTEIFKGKYDKEFDEHLESSLEIYRANMSFIANQILEINEALEKKLGKSHNQEKYIELATMPDGGLQCLIQCKGMLGLSFPKNYIHASNPSQKTIQSSLDFAIYIQSLAKVKILTGELCGLDGKDMAFRVTISKTPEKFKTVFDSIAKTISQLEAAPNLEKSPESTIISIEDASKLKPNNQFCKTELP